MASQDQALKLHEKYLNDKPIAEEIGQSLSSQMLDQLKQRDIDHLHYSASLASFLHHFLSHEHPELAQQTLEWAFDKLSVRFIERIIPHFVHSFAFLARHKHTTRKNQFIWGDIDFGAWIEEHPKKQIIVIECKCAARDDNICLFIYEPGEYIERLHARRLWPKTKRVKGFSRHNHGWDYVEEASILIYRQMQFEVHYRDFRDVGYCFSYEKIAGTPKTEGMLAHFYDMQGALSYLDTLFYECQGMSNSTVDPVEPVVV